MPTCVRTLTDISQMVDMVASNLKLKQRSRNMLRKLSKVCEPKSDADLDALLLNCSRSVKLALLVAETGLSVGECQSKLEQVGGVLAKALSVEPAKGEASESQLLEQKYVLCIDGGGTKCAAVIMNHKGDISRGLAGPCNL